MKESDLASVPDEILVVSAILGDLRAFDELVRRYAPAVLRLARTMVGELDAEDVAQEAWLMAFRALPSIESLEKFGAWLMVITRNRARRAYNRQKKRDESQVALDAFLLEQWTALHAKAAVPAEEHEDLRMALDRLPEPYGIVLKMRFFDALPLHRIGAFLDLPVSTIKWRVFRGKQLLKEELALLERKHE